MIALLGPYSKEVKDRGKEFICTKILIAILFVIANNKELRVTYLLTKK